MVEPIRTSAELPIEQPMPTQLMTSAKGMLSRPLFPTTNRLLASIPQAELNALRPYLKHVRLVANQVLLVRGCLPEHVFFITEGLAAVVDKAEPEEIGVQVAMIGREGLVGALALLSSNSDAAGCSVMQIPGSALRISTTELRSCLSTCPVLHDLNMRFAQSLTRQLMRVAAWNASCTFIGRYSHWLLMAHERMDGAELPVTQEAIAHLLGVRRPRVTVATTTLQKAGILSTSRGKIRILNRTGLEAMISD